MTKLRFLLSAGLCLALGLWVFSPALASEGNVLDGEELLITSGDPDDPLYANAGANLRTGVGSIFVQFASTVPFGFLCTASVIDDYHLLTAAHCVRNSLPDGSPDQLIRIVVILPSGVNYLFFSEDGEVAGFAVPNPLYDLLAPAVGAFAPGDVAVIRMAQPFPADVERYELYRTFDEFGQETRHYGHGRFGKGNKGATGGSNFFFARTGLNMYEQTLAPFFGSALFDQLLHDYDSGGSKHNAMAWWFSGLFLCAPENPDNPPQAQDGQCTTFKDGNYPDFKGFGTLEVGIAPGDSGGPGFIDGKIAGVHSFGFTHFCTGVTNGTDFTCGLDSSYGEMAGDSRVSSNAPLIDGVVAGGPVIPIPEPAPLTGSGSGAAVSLPGEIFMANTFAQRMRQPMTFEEFKAKVGIE